MLPIHVGIGHEHDLVVPQLCRVEILPDTAAERRDHCLDLVILQRTIQTRLLHVEDLSAQRQYRLSVWVPTLDGRAASGVTLDEKHLTDLGVPT